MSAATSGATAVVGNDRSLYRCVWLVEDPDRTLAELVAEATADLPDLLFEEQVQPAGRAHWRLSSQDDGRTFLVVDMPVTSWVDPVRSGRKRRATYPKGRP